MGDFAPAVQIIQEKKQHSVLGMISFGIAVFTMIVVIGFVLFIGFYEAFAGGIPENDGSYIIIGSIMFLMMFVSMISLALGVIGLFEKTKNRLFSILGLTFNAATIISVILLMVIGSME